MCRHAVGVRRGRFAGAVGPTAQQRRSWRCARPDSARVDVLNEAELSPSTGQRPIALWAVPRSVSTALERSMRARGDLTVFHEPFSAYYYLSRERSSDRFAGGAQPDPAHDWRTILDGLLRAGEEGQVFFKDMAYHVSGCMTPELVKSFRHAFLIRHPRHTLPSLLKKLPDFTLEEAGFEQQHRLMRVVVEACPDEFVVIDGEELRRSPEAVVERFSRKVGLDFRPEALSWKPGFVSDEQLEPGGRWPELEADLMACSSAPTRRNGATLSSGPSTSKSSGGSAGERPGPRLGQGLSTSS